MKTNTIQIDSSIYAGAVRYAEAHNVSVQQLAEQYLASLVLYVPSSKDDDSQQLTPKVRSMCFGHGLDDRLDEKAILEEELLRKHL